MPRFSRLFRFYEKKRGDRRTGSTQVASLGEAFFFGIFFCAGCTALVLIVDALVWPEFRANRHFAEVPCVVVAAEVGERTNEETGEKRYRPEIHIRYTAGGRTYEDSTYDVTHWYSDDRAAVEQSVAQFEVGKTYSCWYDPMDPRHAVLVRGYSGWLYLFLIVPISFIVVGSGGFVYSILNWNSSAERRAATAQANAVDLFETGDRLTRDFPTLPADANVTNSPGTTLAYRLPVASAPGWTLFATLVACLLWNGIVALLVVMAVRTHIAGRADWPLTALVIPFVVLGVGLIYYLLRQLLMTTGVGATRIEISRHPLCPGEQCDLFVSQAGRLTMKSLELVLACNEKAIYREGTDTRTELRRVFEERAMRHEDFEIHQGRPFETHCTIRVPRSAMHSFRADHNEVNWELIVRGDVEGWPPYERTFQILVAPARNGTHAE